MACLEETQLLRALILRLAETGPWPFPVGIALIAVLSLIPNVGPAQNRDNAGNVPFADGATGGLAPSIAEMIYGAEREGAALKDRLSIQPRMEYTPPVDMDALRTRALNSPRVRALLNADGPETSAPRGSSRERWDGARAWVLVSFSMPPTALKQSILDAKAFGIPVVMQGFVDNSVYKTREALIEVFGSDTEIEGFGIDPTMFARFDVTTVPTLIVVDVPFDICETPGCEGDAAPRHDRLSGNIRLEHGLRLMAATGDAAAAAQYHLALKSRDRP